ncbi:Nn.00g103280.m01.CDS01 [Neocucurbitaria sp. VM-36]
MSFIRSSALRASSFARAARPTRYLRTAELQPWQRAVQRRTYASAHGAHGEAKSSDVPWAAAAAAGTAAGLYFVLTQDLSHGESHDEHHGDAHGKEHDEEEAPADESKEEETKDESEANTDSTDEKKDDSKDEKKPEPKKDESKEASPDKTDKPDPAKESKSQNETSGKQQGLSNDDTHHSSEVSKQDEKSKKGEGVAETAKLKGTVSTDRPAAENKEERGKAQSDKDA